MSIPEFKWWMSNPIAVAMKALFQKIWEGLESKIYAVFKAARIGWTTETGVEIFWADTNIKPEVDTDLKRSFLQSYSSFLRNAGTSKDTELLTFFFGLPYVYGLDTRDDPILNEIYPFQIVRYWIPPVDKATEIDIRNIIKVTIPARCTKHYQLLTWTESMGFGRTPFGRRFGR